VRVKSHLTHPLMVLSLDEWVSQWNAKGL